MCIRDSCFADHDQPCLARGVAEGLVEIGVYPWTDRLQCQAHRFARDGDKAFETQDVVGPDGVCDLLSEGIRICDFATCDDEAFEFVMTMLVFMVVVVILVIIMVMMVMDFVTVFQVALCSDALAKQDIHGQGAHGCFDNLHACPGFGFETGGQRACFFCVQKVGLVDHNHISTGDLVFEQFGQRCFCLLYTSPSPRDRG